MNANEKTDVGLAGNLDGLTTLNEVPRIRRQRRNAYGRTTTLKNLRFIQDENIFEWRYEENAK